MKQSICKRCGQSLEYDSNYCRFCGQEIDPPNSPHEKPNSDYDFVYEPDYHDFSKSFSSRLLRLFWWCVSIFCFCIAIVFAVEYPTLNMKIAAQLVILGAMILGLGSCPAIVDILEEDPSLQTVARLRVPLMFIAMVAFLVRIIYVNF